MTPMTAIRNERPDPRLAALSEIVVAVAAEKGVAAPAGFENVQASDAAKAVAVSLAAYPEGGFAPNLKSNEEAVENILEAIEKAGYKADEKVMIALGTLSAGVCPARLLPTR